MNSNTIAEVMYQTEPDTKGGNAHAQWRRVCFAFAEAALCDTMRFLERCGVNPSWCGECSERIATGNDIYCEHCLDTVVKSCRECDTDIDLETHLEHDGHCEPCSERIRQVAKEDAHADMMREQQACDD